MPKEVIELFTTTRDPHLYLMVEDEKVRIVNAAIYVMAEFQNAMEGAAEKIGITSEEDVMKLVEEIRYDKKASQ